MSPVSTSETVSCRSRRCVDSVDNRLLCRGAVGSC